MPSIQFLGEDVDLQDALARLSSKKVTDLANIVIRETCLREITQSPPSLIIIAPSRQNSWNVVRVSRRNTYSHKKYPTCFD